MNYVPSLEKSFRPMIVELRKFKEKATVPFAICVERQNGYRYRYELNVLPGDNEENYEMIERVIKSILWVVGGFKIYLGGNDYICKKMQEVFSLGGKRDFDVDFMQKVYDQKFEVVPCTLEEVPASIEASLPAGGNLDGCRIGFDAGGSDRKVSAVVNGEVIFSKEVVWFPKTNEDPKYHYEGILDSFRLAASKMPRVDAIGVSSAGVYVNNKIMVASLFLKVNDADFEKKVKNMYIDVAKEMGENIPLEVANDGDVTALAGAIDLNDNCVLGIAMGTSEAVGYINDRGGLNGWLSELAFVPVDYDKDSMVDEWSGDYGCGVKYFSQDSVIKLAEYGGFKFDEKLSPAEKLKVIQGLMKEGSPLARQIYEDIGTYLGYTLPYYAMFYDIKHILLLGRVTSGEGGNIVMDRANQILAEEFPEYSFRVEMPDETNRRVGQSIAAASLAASRK